MKLTLKYDERTILNGCELHVQSSQSGRGRGVRCAIVALAQIIRLRYRDKLLKSNVQGHCSSSVSLIQDKGLLTHKPRKPNSPFKIRFKAASF